MKRIIVCLAVGITSLLGLTPCGAEPVIVLPPAAPSPELTLEQAVAQALENHPDLAAFRLRRGVAAANVVIARTYPHNPILSAKAANVAGPNSVPVPNRVLTQVGFNLTVEIRHQGTYRKEEAQAAVSRADWEIMDAELQVAIHVLRAYWGVLYRNEKIRLLEATVQLNRQVSDQVKRLAEQGRLRGADLILARTEIDDARSQFNAALSIQAAARGELMRSLGTVGTPPPLSGKLEPLPLALDGPTLTQTALGRRADLQARHAAVTEAQAKLKLTRADRFGNPTIGPYWEYDQDRLNFVGGQVSFPLPVLNSKRGEIQLREVEVEQAAALTRQMEVQIQQEVATALARLESARSAVTVYQKEILPHLRDDVAAMDRLFVQGDPGVDVLRVIDIRRKMLRASTGYLESLWDVSQAQAELAAAVGDPFLVLSGKSNP